MAQTLFGFVSSKSSVRARFVEWGDADLVDMLNIELMAAVSEERKKLRSRIEDLSEKIEAMTTQLDLIASITGNIEN